MERQIMMNNNSRISVAVATFNGAPYIASQLDSILAQDLPAEEIIVCDDLSTDETTNILRDYERRSLIKLYVNEQRLGIINNFKRAVSCCKQGNYIAFSDQDDIWLPEKLGENIASLRPIDDGKTPALTFSDLTLVNDQLETIHPSFWRVLDINPDKEDISSLLFGNIVTGCTVMMNQEMRQLFCDMPDDPLVTMHDAWLGLIAYTWGRHAHVNKPLVRYRQHGRNATFATNRQDTLLTRVQRSIAQILNNDAYLTKEINQARTFRDTYASRISPEHLQVINDFIELGKRSFIRKKYSSILARRYRYLNKKK
jgi:glycosyltransferase involved in cell wall biosynthesis